MSKQYVISDPHFGHNNMAIKRGFKDYKEHDKYLIEQYNSVVTKRDVVWILGDITMEKRTIYDILDRLNGLKKIVLGNHDMINHSKSLYEYCNGVAGCAKVRGYMLSHIPIHTFEIDRFKGNIHGHIHEHVIKDERYINVCAEHTGYKPVLFSDIQEGKYKTYNK